MILAKKVKGSFSSTNLSDAISSYQAYNAFCDNSANNIKSIPTFKSSFNLFANGEQVIFLYW